MKYLKNRKKTLLISAFPGCGKSHFYNNCKHLKVLDSDSSTFDKEHFPQNYMDHIRDNIDKVDIILISSHKEVRDVLKENEFDFTLVYPDKDIKEEYIGRYKERGNDDAFVKLLENNWDNWINEIESEDGYQKIVLSNGEYLSDKIDIG